MGGKVRFFLKIKLLGLGGGAGLEDFHVSVVFGVDLAQPPELVVEFEVGGGYDLEDGVAIVFEVELVLIGLVDGHGVGKSFSGEIALVLLACGKSRYEDALPVLQVFCFFSLRHDRYVKLNIIYQYYLSK